MKKREPISGAPKREPHHPADWDVADAGALQALQRGDAEPHLQKRALDFIINRIACTYDMSYRPGDPQATAFAEGKRYVGTQMVKLLNANLPRIRGEQSEQG